MIQTLEQLRAFMHERLRDDCARLFGLPDGPWIERAVENWFDESRNYDRRWGVIEARRPGVGRVLDVAAGCGTFMLHGLRRGYDVSGIEPEEWKRTYYQRKIELCGYPAGYVRRMVAAYGEALPFEDESFDVVTTFQTLEHVADVRQCIAEMARVLRPGGVLYLRAPDYNCFFEPHYRLPFLPTMRRDWAERYLRWLGRPVEGLRSLNWTTERETVASLRRLPYALSIERTRDFSIEQRRRAVEAELPPELRGKGVAGLLNAAHQLRRQAGGWLRCFGQERVIDLWVTKSAAEGCGGGDTGLRCAA